MIDKNWKLQRYDRKDYTELVEFPVEIVGRDGVVRRYTFEDSIRLYQRRITFASIRYRDGDLVRAEVGHCRARIEQLRRSYFHRYGWGTPEGQPSAHDRFGDLAGEVAAFLCRVMRCDDRPELRFESMPSDHSEVTNWYVTPRGATGMLLYVHRFRGDTADRVREGFFAQLKELERAGAQTDGEIERLLAFHHTVDCGFILAGRGTELDEFATRSDEPSMDLTPTPFDGVLELVRRGDTDQALERCQTLVSGQPWHLNAYLAGAMIAIHLDEPLVAEEMARIGSHYFPEEGLLLWYLGVARTLQGRFGDAEQALRDAITLCPECTGARGALLRLLLNQGRIRDAISVLEERPRNGLDQEGVEPALDNLSYWLRWRGPGMAFGMAIAVVGVVLLPVVTIAGAGLVALGATCAGGVFFIAGQKARAWMLRPSVEDLSVGIKRLQRRMRERPRIS